MATTADNTPCMVTRGFLDRVNRMLRDWEQGGGKPNLPRRQHSSPVDVPIRVVAVFSDYVSGYRWDFATEEVVGSLLYVAKPYDLKRSVWDGLTIGGVAYVYDGTNTRTANGITQTLHPPYRVRVGSGDDVTYEGDLIWCCPSATGLTDPNEKPITLRDLNEDGRAYVPDEEGEGSSAELTVIKFDGSRTDACYTGHVWTDAGAQGAACRFKFPNDPGDYDLLSANEYVLAAPAPSWDTSGWSGSGDKYWAILTPWAAFA